MDARLVASRLPAIPMYGQPFNAPHFPGYLPYGPTDASAFYSPLQAGENADAWRAGLTQAAAAAYYDPALAAHYGYGYGPMGLSDGARRKNATRETTSTLKAWLNEHRKNPYPTKGEKIMLAIITKMTLTQVSTWFANARRRLKKENKMTWSPRNRCGDEDDDDIMDGDDDNNLNNNSNSQMREGHASGGERNNSRCSSPSPSNIGSTTSDAPHRISSFDLPRQGALHPFMQRPDITGTFSIQGPATSIGGNHIMNGNVRIRNQVDDEEEIDLESVEDEKKGAAFVRRSHSTERHSSDDSLQRRPPVSSPSRGQHLPRCYPNATNHPAFQSSQPNPATAAALARHRLQPHVLASMNADIRNLPSISQSSSIGPLSSKISRRDSASPRSHPYSRTAATSPTSSVASSSSVTSPSKPKIWSLADVATSNESNKNINSESNSQSTSSANHSLTTSPTPGMTMFPGRAHGVHGHHRSPLNPEAQATIRNWMDGMMQQKMAAAAAAAAAMSGGQGHPPPFFPNALLPQHLAAALNPAALAVAASLPRGTSEGGRFPHPFPGFAELAAQRAQMAAQVAELQSHPVTAVHTSPSINTNGLLLKAVPLQRNRIVSSNDEKSHSPASAVVSPPHPDSQSGEISNFSAHNTRPDSSDSGIASAETSKDNLTQGNESTSAK